MNKTLAQTIRIIDEKGTYKGRKKDDGNHNELILKLCTHFFSLLRSLLLAHSGSVWLDGVLTCQSTVDYTHPGLF